MSYAQSRIREFTIDWVSWALVGLLAVFQTLCYLLLSLDSQPSTVQTTSVSLGVGVVVLAIVEVLLLLGLFRLFKRLPDWLKSYIKRTVKYTVYTILYFGTQAGLYYLNPLYAVGFAMFAPVGAYLGYKIEGSEYLWILFNIAAIVAGATVVRFMAHAAAPVVVLVVMVLFTVYDHAAVNLSDIMGELVEFSSTAHLPNFLVIPNQRKCDMEAVFDGLSGDMEKPESVTLMIGLGDFIFPTLLAAAAFVSYGALNAIVAGTVAGTLLAAIVMRDALTRHEMLPALVWLNTGAILGFFAGIVASGTPVMLALGL